MFTQQRYIGKMKENLFIYFNVIALKNVHFETHSAIIRVYIWTILDLSGQSLLWSSPVPVEYVTPHTYKQSSDYNVLPQEACSFIY